MTTMTEITVLVAMAENENENESTKKNSSIHDDPDPHLFPKLESVKSKFDSESALHQNSCVKTMAVLTRGRWC